MPVYCHICEGKAIYSVPRHGKSPLSYCAAHIPTVHKAGASKGLYPLISAVEEVVEEKTVAPKKKAAKVEPVVEETPVEEVATPEEIAVESTDEDN